MSLFTGLIVAPGPYIPEVTQPPRVVERAVVVVIGCAAITWSSWDRPGIPFLERGYPGVLLRKHPLA